METGGKGGTQLAEVAIGCMLTLETAVAKAVLNFDFWNRWFRRLISMLFFLFLLGLGSVLIADVGVSDSTAAIVAKPVALEELESRKASLQVQMKEKRLEVETLGLELKAILESNGLDAQTVGQAVAVASLGEVEGKRMAVDTLSLSANEKVKAKEQINRITGVHKEMLVLRAQEGVLNEEISELTGQWMSQSSSSQAQAQLVRFWKRLALVLPVLLSGVWLFAKKRTGKFGAFVVGYFWFGLYAFFFELVPYAPSFGGYIRYVVGLVLTVVGGYYGLRQLDVYSAKRKARIEAEAKEGGSVRDLDLETAVKATKNKQCPSCQQNWELTSGGSAPLFCAVCATSLHTKCHHCGALGSSLFRFCSSCGTPHRSAEVPTDKK